MKKVIFILITATILSSCATQHANRLATYGSLYKEDPVAIMIMPPINKSTKVDAKMSFYNTLSVPLADNGYYVLPPSITMKAMQDQSAYDSELLIEKPMNIIKSAFGADAVLFTIVHNWRKLPVNSEVEVQIEYIIKSTKTNEILYNRLGLVTINSTSYTGSVLADIALDVVKTALTKEVYVAKKCNNYTFEDIPKGKYSRLHAKDQNYEAGDKEFVVVLLR